MIIIKNSRRRGISKEKKLGGDISVQTEKKPSSAHQGSKTFATSAILSESVETAGLECFAKPGKPSCGLIM
jgi:hypothetical protein